MNSNTSNHNMIGDLLGKAAGNSNLVGDLIGGMSSGNSTSPAMGIGTSLISGLFGDKIGGIANLVSNFAGIKSSSSNSLLGIGGSLIASFLGNKMSKEGLNFGGIMNWLGGQKNEIESAIPSGFSSILGGASSTVNKAATSAASTVGSTINNDDDNKGGGMKWLLPLLLLGLLGLGIFGWLKGCNKTGDDASATATVPTSNSSSMKPLRMAANTSCGSIRQNPRSRHRGQP